MKAEWLDQDGTKLWRAPGMRGGYEGYLRVSLDEVDLARLRQGQHSLGSLSQILQVHVGPLVEERINALLRAL